MPAKSQHETKKDFELTQQDISDIKKRRRELLDSGGVIYRCIQRSLDGGKEAVFEYDAQHFANAKCTVEDCGGKAWFSGSPYYEKNLLCLPHSREQHYANVKMQEYANMAWKDLCHARRRVLRPLRNNTVSYSDLLLFYHPEMVEPSYIVLCALR
jgi:hypothetical protein